MGHVFAYPVVREIRRFGSPAPGMPAPRPRPWTTQRSLVEASLLRCPERERAHGRRS